MAELRTAFLFPGQGSHAAGMVSAWDGHATAKRTIDEISEIVGRDLRALGDDAEACARTAVAQPAVYAVSIAAWRALTETGISPVLVAGHSLGEVAATVAAGSLSVRDGALLALERGAAMAAACAGAPGTMTALLGLDDETVEAVLAATPEVTVANRNAPGQVVLSGPHAALDAAVERAREAGARVLPLTVEGAFHSPAMTPAMVRVDAHLRRTDLTDPAVDLLSGVDARVLTTGGAVRRGLTEGVLAPVRWREVQDRLATFDLDLVVEVGPGGVLRGLARRSLRGTDAISIDTPQSLASLADRLADRALVPTGANR
ncbi:MAG: ACP S-malonyltransferase [Actinobacteria bacterium]|nr:ACP S-malonyltransferase [Actinomycetota bacterium]